MPSGTIKITLRPLKLAFLVNPSNTNALLKIIQINTFLWGGTYNPIIPALIKNQDIGIQFFHSKHRILLMAILMHIIQILLCAAMNQQIASK